MSVVPAELRYTTEHEWVRVEGDGTVVVGITDHAQHQLGELVYVELPETARSVAAGEGCAVVESVKAASDVYAPLGGVVTAVNESLNTQPDLVNRSPYGDGWLFRMKPAGEDLGGLLDAPTYQQLITTDA